MRKIICECGAVFEGGPNAKNCPACRTVVHRLHAMHTCRCRAGKEEYRDRVRLVHEDYLREIGRLPKAEPRTVAVVHKPAHGAMGFHCPYCGARVARNGGFCAKCTSYGLDQLFAFRGGRSNGWDRKPAEKPAIHAGWRGGPVAGCSSLLIISSVGR